MEPIEELAGRVSAIVAVAQTGLAWSDQLYERERYERILQVAAEMAAILSGGVELSTGLLAEELKQGWLALVTPGAAGYVTPKISTGALCFDKEGRLLLGKRSDSGIWFMPTGWQEVGLTPAQNVVKEVLEEIGIECRPLRLIGVRDTRLQRASNPAIHNISVTFLCEALTTEINLHPLETLEAGFFTESEAVKIVPDRVVPLIEHAFAAWRGELNEPYFDRITV
jgi:ADP-ribose pyrophosphatase YjhB (NUDIX family)